MEDVVDLPSAVAQVDRNHHRPDADDSQVGDDKFGAVAQEEGDAVALAQANPLQGRDPAFHCGVEFPVGVALHKVRLFRVGKFQGQFVRCSFQCNRKKCREIHRSFPYDYVRHEG